MIGWLPQTDKLSQLQERRAKAVFSGHKYYVEDMCTATEERKTRAVPTPIVLIPATE